jgi:PKD repeat protein
MNKLYRKLSFTLALLSCSLMGNAQDMLLTGVYDGPLTGGLPKGVEVYACTAIPDLSFYGVGSANNGGGSDGEEFTFPAVSATAGTYIYLTSDSAGFHDFMGFAADYTTSAMSINGDDAIELFFNTNVIDVFGDINVDGSGEPWEYADGWAYRNDGTGPDGTTFQLCAWSFSGPNALDGETTNASAATPIPIGTYSKTPIPLTAIAMGADGCDGETISFTGMATGGACPFVSWLWDFGDGNLATTQNATHIYANPGSYTVALTVLDNNSSADSMHIHIDIHPSPVAGITNNTTSTCAPATGMFADISTISAGSITGWEWNFDVNNTGNVTPTTASVQTAPPITFSAAGTYPIELVVTSDMGCTDTTVINLVVDPLDDASWTTPGSLCITGGLFDLSPTVTGITGGTFTGTAVSGNMFDPATAGAGTHTLTYTTNGPCPNVEYNDILVTSLLDAAFTFPPVVCIDDTPFTMTPSTGGGSWMGTGITDTITGLFDPSLAGVGTHNITHNLYGPCGATQMTPIDVIDRDDASFNYANTMLCQFDFPAAVTISGTTGGMFSGGNSNYSVDPSTGEIGLINLVEDTLNIIYTTQGLCPDIDTVQITMFVCIGVEEQQLENLVTIHPNPSTNGQFNLDLNALKDWTVNIDVTDISGRIVRQEKVLPETGMRLLNLSENAPGAYMIRLSGEFGTVTKKLIINR